jgi:hypothetical protein
MEFTKESEFENALIEALSQSGWGEENAPKDSQKHEEKRDYKR